MERQKVTGKQLELFEDQCGPVCHDLHVYQWGFGIMERVVVSLGHAVVLDDLAVVPPSACADLGRLF